MGVSDTWAWTGTDWRQLKPWEEPVARLKGMYVQGQIDIEEFEKSVDFVLRNPALWDAAPVVVWTSA